MWFWLLSSIAGSIIGSATESWFRDTKLGIWFYTKMDQLYTWASKRYGIKILTDEEERMKKFPQLSKKLNDLEERIKKLEKRIKDLEEK
jgi:DNA-binding HxlR family transcriptional regulator